jgi:hypothetical protein
MPARLPLSPLSSIQVGGRVKKQTNGIPAAGCCRVSAVSEFMEFLPLSIKFAVSQSQNIELTQRFNILSLYTYTAALTPTLAPLALVVLHASRAAEVR